MEGPGPVLHFALSIRRLGYRYYSGATLHFNDEAEPVTEKKQPFCPAPPVPCGSGERRSEARAGARSPASGPYVVCRMADVTRILHAIEHGDSRAAEKLLPLVYDQLKREAQRRMAAE